MYNGIGLTTTRGTGTSGHVQKNIAALRGPKRRAASARANPHDALRRRLNADKAGNAAILAHEGRRKVEVAVAELEEQLAARGYERPTIDEMADRLRQDLLSRGDEEEAGARDRELESERAAPGADKARLQRLKQLQEHRNTRLRHAMRLEDGYVEGAAFKHIKPREGDSAAANGNAVPHEGTAADQQPAEVPAETPKSPSSASSSSLSTSSESHEEDVPEAPPAEASASATRPVDGEREDRNAVVEESPNHQKSDNDTKPLASVSGALADGVEAPVAVAKEAPQPPSGQAPQPPSPERRDASRTARSRSPTAGPEDYDRPNYSERPLSPYSRRKRRYDHSEDGDSPASPERRRSRSYDRYRRRRRSRFDDDSDSYDSSPASSRSPSPYRTRRRSPSPYERHKRRHSRHDDGYSSSGRRVRHRRASPDYYRDDRYRHDEFHSGPKDSGRDGYRGRSRERSYSPYSSDSATPPPRRARQLSKSRRGDSGRRTPEQEHSRYAGDRRRERWDSRSRSRSPRYGWSRRYEEEYDVDTRRGLGRNDRKRYRTPSPAIGPALS